jgi:hypothetical protein
VTRRRRASPRSRARLRPNLYRSSDKACTPRSPPPSALSRVLREYRGSRLGRASAPACAAFILRSRTRTTDRYSRPRYLNRPDSWVPAGWLGDRGWDRGMAEGRRRNAAPSAFVAGRIRISLSARVIYCLWAGTFTRWIFCKRASDG